LRAGQRWRFTVRLRRPHGNYNPHGFDVERWLLERDLRANGYVRLDAPRVLIDDLVPHPAYLVERMRENVRARLLAALADRPYRGVVVALAVGDQQAIPREQWALFTRTGVGHLMSISGLHITMVAALAFALVTAMWRVLPLAGRIPARSAATTAGLGAAIAYAVLAGFAVPAQRTVLMLAIVAAALWSRWRWPTPAVLGLALGVVAVFDPMSVASPGFWLSFGAVAAIALVAGSRLEHAGWIKAWLRSQWAVTVALVPLLLALFQLVSLVSPLANAVAIPLVSLVVAPLALAAIAVPADVLAQLAHATMAPGMGVLEWLARAPAVAWQQHAPPWWTVAAALAGAGWLLLPRGVPARGLGPLAMLPLFLARPAGPADSELWVTVLDVGQGLAVLARTSGHALLFDTGPAYPGGGDAGERIVVPFLRGEGIRSLDALVVSHDDLDHSGGALSVLAALPVRQTLSALPPAHPIRLASSSGQRCLAGQHWEWDSVRFEVLHPVPEVYNEPRLKDNDRSCVLRIAARHGTALITADIEAASERMLLARTPGRLRADIVVAAHHGSRTSSEQAFVEAAGARMTVFAVGYRNRFGHPHPAVTARWRASGARLLRTDVSGAISFRIGQGGIEVEEWRLARPRYWHDLN
jgi:competence protein ComEC